MISKPTPDRLYQPLKGILLIAVAVFVFTVQDALVKWLSRDFATVQILFVRSVIMMLPVLLVLLLRHGRAGLSTRRPLGHLLRLLLNLLAFLLFFFALSRLPLTDTVALMLTAPLFMALLSGPLLGEYASGKVWLATTLGFIGVLVMLAPQSARADLAGVAAVLAASVVYTLWMIQTRYLTATERGQTMVFYSAAGIAAVTACAMPFYWRTPPDLDSALLLGAVGLCSALGHSLLVQAYRFAPVYLLGPFDYTALVWAALLGFFIWGDVPGAALIIGATLIVACGLYLFVIEKRKA